MDKTDNDLVYQGIMLIYRPKTDFGMAGFYDFSGRITGQRVVLRSLISHDNLKFKYLL